MLAGLVYLLPVLLLLPLLALRLYPGERALVALASRRRPRRPGRAGLQAAVPRAALARRASVPRGGLLIAAALAVRPPPRCAGASS